MSPLNLLTEIKEACGITLDMRVGIVFNVIEDKFFLIYCWMQFTFTVGKLSHGGWCWDSLLYILFCLVLLAGDEIFMEKCGRFHFMKEHILSLAKQTGHTCTIYS